MEDITVNVTADIEGIAEANGEKHTIDKEVAETIDALIKRNLRNRYSHIDEDEELFVLAVEGPNVVVIERPEESES